MRDLGSAMKFLLQVLILKDKVGDLRGRIGTTSDRSASLQTLKMRCFVGVPAKRRRPQNRVSVPASYFVLAVSKLQVEDEGKFARDEVVHQQRGL